MTHAAAAVPLSLAVGLSQRERLAARLGDQVKCYQAIIEESGGRTAPPSVPTA